MNSPQNTVNLPGGTLDRSRDPSPAATVVRVLVAALTGIVALALLVGGGVLAWAQLDLRDGDGHYTASGLRAAGAGHALVVEDLGLQYLGVAPGLRPPGGLDFRVTAAAAGSDAVFVGIGPSDQVAGYLADVARDRVVDVDDRTDTVDVVPAPGTRTPAPPATQTFWAASAQGPGEQRVDWPARQGRWTVVVMNADGAAGVDVVASGGVAIGVLTPLAIGLLVAGLLFLVLTLVLVPWSRTKRQHRSHDGAAPGPLGHP
ncbi:hypothetical protein [Pseudonocardia pini]|uniref:hypothetical protein n=1 Tax=Pseudonocardia pini TaxID=2758030 RepID=UPI0015F104FB|nr:hypothetical protein [Pseudonocardia pini]